MIRILTVLALATALAAAETVLDPCQALTPAWSFANGAEFPGAKGRLAAAEAPAQGLVLGWDFSGGGGYVSATWKGPAQAGLAGVAVSITTDAPCTLAIRMRDEHGRTFQSRYIAAKAGATTITQACAGPWGGSWGGKDGTGPLPGAPVSFALVVDKRAPTPATGAVTITKLAVSDAAPANP